MWLSRLFKRKKNTTEETLVFDPLMVILNEDKCPDCGAIGRWLMGPRGGIAQNIMCAKCRSEFNVTPFSVDRI